MTPEQTALANARQRIAELEWKVAALEKRLAKREVGSVVGEPLEINLVGITDVRDGDPRGRG